MNEQIKAQEMLYSQKYALWYSLDSLWFGSNAVFL